MTLSRSIDDREYGKFTESPTRPNQSAVEVVSPESSLITLVDTTNSNFIYIGSALPASLPSASVWRIQRVDLTTSEIKILYAGESQAFTNVWDNRVGLTYG